MGRNRISSEGCKVQIINALPVAPVAEGAAG